MHQFIDERPNWQVPKYTDYKIDLSNNLTYDSVLNYKLRDLYRSVNFDTRQYTDEYSLYKTLSAHEQRPIKNIAIGFGIGEMICRFFEYNYRMAIVSPTWSMPEVFSNVKNKPFTLIQNAQNFSNAEILYLATPNGIDGQVVSSDVVRDVAKYYRIVIIDEAYYDWHDNDSMVDIADNIIVLRTLSKSLGQAGLRFSYAIGAERIISFIQKHRPSCASHSFMIPILETLLELIPEHVARMQQTKLYLETNYKCKPTYANFVLFNELPTNMNLVKIKGNRMALCDMEIAQCLK